MRYTYWDSIKKLEYGKYAIKNSDSIIFIVAKILNKFKIFKNKDKTLEDLDKYIKEFNEGAKKIFENKPQFFGLIFLQFISLRIAYRKARAKRTRPVW